MSQNYVDSYVCCGFTLFVAPDFIKMYFKLLHFAL